jgi:MFS family permease
MHVLTDRCNSGLMAAGIAQMSGVGGYLGWRWIFILEGILTIAFGVATFFVLPDTPRLSKRWLSEPEIRYCEHLYTKHRGGYAKQQSAEGEVAVTKVQKWKILRSVLLDWQIYCQALIFMSSAVVSILPILHQDERLPRAGSFSRSDGQGLY